MTSTSSCVDLNSQSVAPSIVSQRMDLCLKLRPTATVRFHQQILPNNFGGCRLFHIHQNLHINLGIHHAVFQLFFIPHAVLHEVLIHNAVLVTFLTFPNFFSLSQIFTRSRTDPSCENSFIHPSRRIYPTKKLFVCHHRHDLKSEHVPALVSLVSHHS